jgi:DNA phosphorothioation-dependent restriction protein DptH
MNRPNDDPRAIERLATEYQALPAALKDILLLVPAGKLEERHDEYPHMEVRPLKFASSELQAGHWRFLMGAVGNQATYIRKLNQVMRSLRNELTVAGLRAALEHAGLPDNLKELASMRLDLAQEYIDDTTRLGEVIRPGRLVIVDLRDEFIEKDEALGLFVVLLQLFADATFQGRSFNKLVVFDEAHKYIGNPDLVDGWLGKRGSRDAPQRHKHPRGEPRSAVGPGCLDRALVADSTASVQLAGVAEAHSESERRSAWIDA